MNKYEQMDLYNIMIEEYKYLADNPDNAELDAIIVNEVGVIANRKVLEHNLKELTKILNN